MAPVARSYDGRVWEISAGKYTSISITYRAKECILQLPPLSEGEEYSVLESNYTLSRTDEVARFLEQTTFGTTLNDLDSFDIMSPVDIAMSNWIKDQIENKPMSLHRNYFRKRIVHHYNYPHPIARPYRPCEKNTRYSKFSFSSKDKAR